MSDGMGREPAYLSSHATNRYFIPNWGLFLTSAKSTRSVYRSPIFIMIRSIRPRYCNFYGLPWPRSCMRDRRFTMFHHSFCLI